jgi:hypothetical protein
MAVLGRMTAALASVLIAVPMVTACGKANAAGGMPSRSPEGPGAVFTFEAEEGAHPVGGRGGEWVSPESEIMVWENENIVKIDAADPTGFDFVRVELNAAGNVPIQVGEYPDARGQDGFPDSPGMLVISNGLGCVDVYGEFVVEQIERDAAGDLVALDANFVQRCGDPAGPALHGRIHFQS